MKSEQLNYTQSLKHKIIAAALAVLFISIFSCEIKAATFTVTNVNDSGAGSLRQAILSANALPNEAHTINFNIGTGLKTIALTSALPAIATNMDVTVDGTTQGGFANVPLIELNGASAGASANGLYFYNSSGAIGSVTVKSLIINRFGANGIKASNVKSLNVYGCYIGTDSNGSSDFGNGQSGIYLNPASNNVVSNIGGSGTNQRNVIAGNDGDGVYIYGFYNADVKIAGNYIGTNASAIIDLGNSGNGIVISDFSPSSKVVIGGSLAAERNVIAGNNKNGIWIGLNQSVSIWGNYIGLGANGTTAIGNAQDGVYYSLQELDSDNVVIGGAGNLGNTIAANGGDGIEVGYYDNLGLGTISPLILGNRIGTDYNGANDRGNAQNGILVTGLASPVIGRENSGEGNTISGNDGHGIYFAGGSGTGAPSVVGNRIGVTSQGAPLGNSGNGILMNNTYGLQIGKENTPAAVNTISGNALNGIQIGGGSQSFKIVNNLIGTSPLNQAIPNGKNGVLVTDQANTGQIGGTALGAGNTITFNTENGVALKQNPAFQSVPNNVAIIANSIFSNNELGIDLDDNGISINDANDADAGSNDLQNYPIINGASPGQINGTLNSNASKSYRLDFYRVDTCDAGGHGEGRYYLGSTDVSTDASGNASFLATNITLTTGQFITATATVKGQVGTPFSTSEFSPCQTVSQPPGNLSLSSANYTVNEGSSTVTVTVNRTNGSVGTIGVAYATSNGTATGGQDYAATSGTLTFLSGEMSKTFTIAITDDQSDEPAETVNIALSNPTGGAALVSPSSAVLTINDNDAPPTVSANTVQLAEGNEGTTNFVFNVSLSQPSAFPVTVNYQTQNGTATAGIDYVAASGSVSFAAGETTKPVTVSVKADTTPEIDEAFALVLSGAVNASVGNSGTGIILDDDNAGKLQFGSATFSVNENQASATITVTRTNGTAGTVSVDYATQNGTATAGSDYETTAGTLLLLDGQQSATINVPVIQDQTGEQDETVFLSLFNPLGGAALGAVINSTLTITDDDGGVPANVSIGGQITKDNLPLANVAVTLSGSQTATATTNANGQYSFSGLASGGNYLVTPTFSGHSFEPGSRSFTNLTSAQQSVNFTASTAVSTRKLRIASADAQPASTVVVPVDLVSLGNENSAGFSLNYDQNLLSNPQVALGADAANASLVFNNAQAGKLGIVVALPAGQTFAAGTRRVVNVTFQTAQTSLYSTPVEFSNQPVAVEIADADANPLPVAYENGVVTFAHGFEADVAPRPTGTGNGSVTVADFTQIGKFVAGTATADQLNEFQRADAAPRGSKGNGSLTVSDYTQAGRYAAGLDAIQTAGGPTAALSLLEWQELFEKQSGFAVAENGVVGARVIRAVGAQTAPGQQVTVPIELESQGDENAVGFTLNYDPSKFANPVVALGSGATGATLIPNTNQAGKVGIVLGLPAGQTFQAGTRQLVTISLNVAANAAAGTTPLFFNDTPVFREVVNANADVLSTTFVDGSINILGPTAAHVVVGGKVMDAEGRGIGKIQVTLTSAGGATRSVYTNGFGNYQFSDVEVGESYILTVAGKNYIFDPPTRLVNVYDEMQNVDFTAQIQ